VGLECQADVLEEGRASRVVRRRREGDVDLVPFDWQMIPPISRRVDLSSFVSQSTVHRRAARDLLLISLNEKLSMRSSKTEVSSGISSFFARSARR